MSLTADTDDSKLGLGLRHASGRVSKTKRRLRPWLKTLIDSEEIPGLCWLDKEHAKFKIPWKHGGKQDWSPESGRIFMEWAKNTGKYREGIDTPRYARWKTRLRCAFNKASDIIEVSSERQTLDPEPYRVYQFTAVTDVHAGRSSRSRQLSSLSSSSLCDVSTTPRPEMSSDNATTLPAVLAEYDVDRSASDEELCLLKLITATGPTFRQQQQTADDEYVATEPDQNVLLLPTVTDSGSLALTLTSSQLVHTSLPRTQRRDVEVRVYYCGQTVVSRLAGPVCHLQFTRVSADDDQRMPDDIRALLVNSELVELPSFDSHVTECLHDEKVGSQLLSSALCHAVYVYATDDGDLHAYRLCRCAVYHASALMTSGQPVKVPLQGHSLTKIFSYADSFMPALSKYISGDSARPDAHVHLLCGQAASVDQMDNSILVRASVLSQRAVYDLHAADTTLAKLQNGDEIPCIVDQSCSTSDLRR